ncbi:PREDICTED: zinc finger protein 260-like isoform X1 [Cyphomyrmex costatus]|uniref:zinc finger protein 260-like isoform X1 n=1 Tax=Cyphomyrmex costatus TaxID=456900 RepID=UPI000852330E|nr:PREDICTED: zinc finger protein 260-like isoform X1 [Cyphomyrmex costatus]
MLTEQNVIMELTGSSDTVVGFITTDDSHALLAVDDFFSEREDGTLEFMTTPITLMPQNNMLSPTLIKTMDGNFILHSPIFQMNVEDLSGTAIQQTSLLPLMQHLENRSEITEQLKIQDTNKCAITDPLLPKDNSSMLSDKRQLTVDNDAKSRSTPVYNTIQNVYKRSPGRPKKKEVNLQNTQSLQCDICSQEFTKQTLYRKHMENHAEEKPHRCPKCPASFNIPTNFTLHMATHNTGDPKCPECGRKYARMASLKSHMLLHEKEENLFCTECEDAFSTKYLTMRNSRCERPASR